MTDKPNLTVVAFPHSSLVDVPTKLMELAEDIRNGTYGDVTALGIVLMGDKLHVFGFGREADGLSVSCLLRAGSLRIEKQLEEHGT